MERGHLCPGPSMGRWATRPGVSQFHLVERETEDQWESETCQRVKLSGLDSGTQATPKNNPWRE